MLFAGIVMAVALIAIWLNWRRREEPLDRAEIRIIRHFADRIQREQCQPFEVGCRYMEENHHE